MPYDHDSAQSLHTMLVDSRNGYETALEKTDDASMRSFLSRMVDVRTKQADELSATLARTGEPVTDDGSFMTIVHEAVMSVRSLFGGLDASALPGILDGEQRVLTRFDEALAEAESGTLLQRVLKAQRDAVAGMIEEIHTRIEASRR